MKLSFIAFMKSQRATAAIEFCFIVPVLILMAAATTELGHGLQAVSAVDKLASQYAIAWSDCNDSPAGACSTEMALYTPSAALANTAPQLTNTIVVQMFQVAIKSGAANVTYSYPAGASLSSAQSSAALAILKNGQNGVVVTVGYTFTLDYFPNGMSGILPTSVPMSYTVVQLKA